jgi:hypothetical protein
LDAGFEVEVEAVAAGNMTDEEDVARVVAAHRERYGRLDVLVNGDGVESVAPAPGFVGTPMAVSPWCVVPEIVFQRPDASL